MFDQTAPPTYTPVDPITPVVPANPYQDFASQTPQSLAGTPASGMVSPAPVAPSQPVTAPAQEVTQPIAVDQPAPTELNQPVPAPSKTTATPTESLEDQNIFYLLGVTDGTEEQKNEFLDELQQVIWEDFLDEDVKLLLTQEELAELDTMKAAKPTAKLEEQEEVIVYLEKLIPDLEDILLEKALELKADLVKERIAGMRELHKDQPNALTSLDQAERLVQEEKWLSAAQMLNSIPA